MLLCDTIEVAASKQVKIFPKTEVSSGFFLF